MSDAVTQLHGVLGAAALALLAALGIGAVAGLVSRRDLPGLEPARRIGLGLVVAQAAIGLAIAMQGARPGEAIHWLYGALIVFALLAPSSVEVTTEPARRGLLAASTVLAAVFAWRLWGSG